MREHRWWRVTALLGGLIFAVLGQRTLFYRQEDQGWAVILLLVAGLVVVGLSRLKGQEGERREERREKRARLRLTAERVGTVFGLTLTLEVAIATHRPASDYNWQVLLWLVALAGYPLLFLRGDEGARLRVWVSTRRRELLLVAGLVALASLLRLVSLNHIPWPLAEDEGAFGAQALEVLRGQRRNPFLTGYLDYPNLFFFLQAAGFKLLGIGPAGLRLPSALAGALLVVPVYALGRLWFGRWIGLVAAALVASFHFPLHYSRVGLNNIVDPLLAATTLAILSWGSLRGSGRRLTFALAGVTLGLSQYFYASSRLTLLLAGFYLLVEWRRKSLTRTCLLILLSGFFIAFGPLLWTYLQTPDLFLHTAWRADIFRSGWLRQIQAATGRSTLNLLADQLAHAVLAFNYYGDRIGSRLYNPPGPLLDLISGALWLFGLVVALRRRREAGAATLLVWVAAVILLGGALLQNPPTSPPLLYVAPALTLLVALGLSALIETLTRLWPSLTPKTPTLLASGCAILVVTNLVFYFGVYAPRHLYGTVTDEVATRIGQYLAEHRDQGVVYFAGVPPMSFTQHTIRFLGQDAAGQDLPALTGPPTFVRRDRGAVFVFLPERLDELNGLLSYLPDGRREEFYSLKEDRLAFVIYHVAAEEPP